MAKILVFPSSPEPTARRRAAERAAKIQKAVGGRIFARPYQPSPRPNGDGPSAA